MGISTYCLVHHFQWGFYLAFCLVFSLTLILRTVFDSVALYERPLRSLPFLRLVLLSVSNAGATTLVLVWLIKYGHTVPSLATMITVLINVVFVHPTLVKRFVFKTRLKNSSGT